MKKDKKEKDSRVQIDEDIENEVEYEDVEEADSIETKIKKLKKELREVKEEKASLLTDLQKAKADFVNMRKRDEESNKNFVKYAKEEVVLDILPVLDSFDMAFSNKEAWEKVPKEWRVGVEYIYNQLQSTVKNHGVESLDPLGEDFNPVEHDAIETVESEKNDDNKIIAVVQKGYKMGDKIIRAAKVKVGEHKE